MKIEKAMHADLRKILELQYLAYYSEAKLLNNYSIPPLKQSYDEVEEEYRLGIFLKATDEEDIIIGSVRAVVNDSTVFIGKLLVHPDKQGQGIGTRLLLAIENECKGARYELFTSSNSIRNITLYERLGYKRFREQKIMAGVNFIYLEKN